MLQRDPKDWKVCMLGPKPRRLLLTRVQNQDHYAVLGLSKYRYKATEAQIKSAHRKKVLKHHPDKRAASGATEDDSFFKCIGKATEVLSDPVRRRQFDSVDEAADVEPPSKKDTKSGNFFKLWSPVFASEGRFSNKQPVPKLGNDKSTKEEVEHFYEFWFNFDSWRTFEYMDEDVPDDNEHRHQRRAMEKKNMNARKKRKTEDIARLRSLVDTALSLDERIKKFRQQEQEQKHKKRNEMAAEAKRVAEEQAKAKEEEARKAKEAEEAAKADKDSAKKAKEAAKTATKKNKRVVRTAVKDVNYFHTAGGDVPPKQIDAVLNDVDALLAKIDPEDLAALVEKLNVADAKDAGKVQGVFNEEVTRLTGEGKLSETDVKSLRA